MTDENFERFKGEFEPLLVCKECGVIRVKIRDKDIWINPKFDIYDTYKGYLEIFGSHKEEGLCRRCNPEYKGKGEKPEVERRRQERENTENPRFSVSQTPDGDLR